MGQLSVDGLQQVNVCATGLEHELLVEELEDGGCPGFFNHVNGMLVVLKRNALPLNSFLFVLLLLQSEHMLVELLLELLVGIVDAQLLE